jgi:hypothetical protein
MAFFNNNNDKDGYFSNDNYSSDKWYELSPEALEKFAGGVGGYDEYDTYRFWRDQNGVLREIR